MASTTSRGCLDDDEVAAFVDRAIDGAHRRDIEAHLDRCGDCRRWVSAVASDDGITASGPSRASSTPRSDEELVSAGTGVGRYMLLRKIGAGGMGVVAKAYDPELDRHVAIKLLRAQVATRADPKRLLQEARAMARVKHPNVVAIHDVGLHRGHLFIAMEFVQGTDLGQWVARRQRSTEEILEVACAVGRGIEAAHEAGLVHRDLKPANILVGPDDRPQVADFGLARLGALEPEPSTGAGAELDVEQSRAAAGTLGFMAPEQFDGAPVDARSDQFGYCATVYFALHGVLPYPGKTAAEVCGAIAMGRVAAGTRGAVVPRRAHRALLRGLNPDRAQRFDSMSALLAELAPRSRRRRWLQVGGAASVFAAGVLVQQALGGDATDCTVGVRLVRSAWSAEHREQIAEAFAATELPYADTVLQATTAALDDQASRWTQTHALACRARMDGRASERLTDIRMQCLDQSVHALGAWTRRLSEADVATVETVTDGLTELEDPQRCLELVPEQGPVPPTPEQRADVQRARGHLVDARTLLQTGAIEKAQQAIGEAAAASQRAQYPPLAAELALMEGRLLSRSDKLSEAIARFEDAVVAAEGTRHDALAVKARVQLLDASTADPGRLRQSLQLARMTEAAIQRTGNVSAGQSADLDRAVAHAYVVAARPRDAIPYYEAAATTLAETPGVGRADSRRGLGGALLADHRVEEGRRQLDLACREFAEVLGSEHPRTLKCRLALAVSDVHAGDTEAARDRMFEIRAAQVDQLGPDAMAVTSTEHNLIVALRLLGDSAAALPLAQHVATVRGRALGEDSFAAAKGLHVVGVLHRDLGDYASATAELQRALRMTIDAVGPDNPGVAEILQTLGTTHLADGKPQRAYDMFTDELRIVRATVGEEHVDALPVLNNLGAALQDLGRHEAALEFHERALAIAKAELPTNDARRTDVHRSVGAALLALGRANEAAVHFKSALATLDHEPHRALARADTALALAEAALGMTPRDEALASRMIASATETAKRLGDAALLARIAALPG